VFILYGRPRLFGRPVSFLSLSSEHAIEDHYYPSSLCLYLEKPKKIAVGFVFHAFRFGIHRSNMGVSCTSAPMSWTTTDLALPRYVCFHLSTDLLISYVSLTSLKILLDRVSKAWMAVDVSMCVGLIGLSGKLVVCERETCVSSARGSCVRKHVGERARSTNLSSVSSFTLPTLLKTKKLCPRHSMLSCSRRGRTR